jgi:1,4-alpha-glucan branching enzyme
MVTKPVHMGGLGFGMKWMMGWMHDTLNYFKKDPIHRKFHQGDITFSMVYSYTENYMLPLSHDEVVYGKNSILGRMSGDEWQRFSNLRLLYGFMFAHPGAKLLFMGSEFGQYNEWNFNSSLDWNLLDFSPHKTLQNFYKDLNKFYKNHPGFYKKQFSPEGFEWVSLDDANNSVLSFMRKGHDKKENILVICNFTPNVIEHYKIGVPFDCKLKESLNSDDLKYGGSGVVNSQLIDVYQEPFHYKEFSATIKLPPLGVVYFEMV